MSFFYPDTFEIAGQQYKGQRSSKSSKVYIPFTQELPVTIGDVITQTVGSSTRIELKVTDLEMHENLGGDETGHSHLLTLTVHNLTSSAHKPQAPAPISIGTITATQVQVGNNNQQITNISLQEVVQRVAEQGDSQTKGLLRVILENPTVSTLVGVAATAGLSKLLAS